MEELQSYRYTSQKMLNKDHCIRSFDASLFFE